MSTNTFPHRFTWGAATAAYQIEGAHAAGGRQPSVWDMFCRQPGRVFEGHTGDVACDHYNRWREDIALMRELELPAYRFSVAWPRVIPAGAGAVNPEGIGFYDRLVDGLLEAGIEPWVTLFHWDFPHALYLRGGWLNPDSPQWFADYTAAVVDRLSDRVTHWMTHNEPQCFIGHGLRDGKHAPGDRLGWAEVALASHHVLLAHGRAVQVIRARARRPAEVGIVMAVGPAVPAEDNAACIEAARGSLFANPEPGMWSPSWWTDPVALGRYPEDAIRAFGRDMFAFTGEELAIISTPVDFIGLNIYAGRRVRAGADGQPESAPFPPGHPETHFGWKVLPEALYWGPRYFQERYRLPVVITENGLASHDWVALDGKVHDPQRVDFMARYLRELRRACADGVDVRGYFAWSLLDNFEWAEGYRYRFGLVHVDYRTQQRTPKDSACWYREVIRSNGAALTPAGAAAAAGGPAGPGRR